MRHESWMAGWMYRVNLLLLFTLPFHADWLDWVPALLTVYVLGSLTISVGFHRLFCHQSFKASPFWHWFFALAGVMIFYGSPLQWDMTHSKHHLHSDTELDPHPAPWTWRALLDKSYRAVPLDLMRTRRLMRQNPFMHGLVDRDYVRLFVIFCGLIALVSPELLYMAVLPGAGLVQLVGGLHNTLSHTGGRARDWWFLEYLLPASGEWLHGMHHAMPGRSSFRSRWYHFDLGAVIIALIRSR